MISFQVDVTDLRRKAGQWTSFQQVLGQNIDSAMQDVLGPTLVQELSLRTPISDKEEGTHAADYWGFDYLGSFRGSKQGTLEFSNANDYIKFVISGASPHLIEGNPFLVFYWDKVGSVVAFPYVQHPGQEPNDFISEMMDERMNIIGNTIMASVALSLRQTIG